VPTNPELIFTNDNLNGSQMKLTLNDPSLLPKTHGHDDPMAVPYSTSAYSVVLDAAYIVKGLKVFVKTDNLGNSEEMLIPVGPAIAMKTYSIPMYMFGANEDMLDKDGIPLSVEKHGWMGEEKAQEHWAKYPFATFYNGLHPMRKFQNDYWIIEPRTSKTGRKKTAFRAHFRDDFRRKIDSDYTVDSSSDLKDDYKDGFGDEASGLAFLELLLGIDGEKYFATHAYTSLLFRDEFGVYQTGGAGLGGGHIGAGTSSFEGIFYHEQGHAFSLGHAESDYEKGDYPYEQGSLKGSEWGYDVVRNEFIDTFLHTNAETYDGDDDECTNDSKLRATVDGKKKCYKQSVMQGGSRDREPDMNFGQLADYNVAEILEHIEGSMESAFEGGEKVLKDGGRVFHDECTCGNGAYYNFRQWNNTAQEFFSVTPTWEYPHYYKVPLVLIWATIGCAELECKYSTVPLKTSSKQVLTQVYKPHSYVGNTRFVLNPDNYDALKTIIPGQAGAVNQDFCNRGCDFTAYVTLADGTLRKAVIPGSPRDDWQDVDFDDKVRDEVHAKSLLNTGVAVPTGGKDVKRVDIMYTPLAWRGFHNRIPQVVASWSKENGEEKPGAPQSLSLNKITYDFKLDLGRVISVCDISDLVHDEFVVAVEKAIMQALTCDEKLALPPFSSAVVKCVCYGDACESDCQWTRPLPTYSSDSDSSEPSTSVYDATTDTCSGGSVHINDLFPDTSGGTTKYFDKVDENGDGDWDSAANDGNGNMYKLVNPGLSPVTTNGFDGSTSESRDACLEIDSDKGLSALETCYGFIYRSGGFKTFLNTQCMEPCMELANNKYEAFYSLEGAGSWPFRREASGVSFDAINLKIELDITSTLVAGQVYHKLADPALLNKIAAKIVGDAYVQRQFDGINLSRFSMPKVYSSKTYSVPLVYPSASTVCYGLSSWQEPPSPEATPACVTECVEAPPDSPGSPGSDDSSSDPPPDSTPDSSDPPPDSTPDSSDPPPSSTPDSSDPPPSSTPDSSGSPTSILTRSPPSTSPSAVLQVSMYLKGYTAELFNSAARANFRSAVAAGINSPEVDSDDVYIISITDVSVSPIPPMGRKLLQDADEAVVKVYFEILTNSSAVATSYSDKLKSPVMLNIMLASGLSNVKELALESTIQLGSTYTKKSKVEEDMEEFGFALVGVVGGGVVLLVLVLALFICGIARPTSCMGRFLRGRLGEEKYNAKVESHFHSKSMKLQEKSIKLREKSMKVEKRLDKCNSKVSLARAASAKRPNSP
jgi:hypothetical protein